MQSNVGPATLAACSWSDQNCSLSSLSGEGGLVKQGLARSLRGGLESRRERPWVPRVAGCLGAVRLPPSSAHLTALPHLLKVGKQVEEIMKDQRKEMEVPICSLSLLPERGKSLFSVACWPAWIWPQLPALEESTHYTEDIISQTQLCSGLQSILAALA